MNKHMKKVFALVLASVLLLTLSACSEADNSRTSRSEPSEQSSAVSIPRSEFTSDGESVPDESRAETEEPAQANNILVAYFSCTGNTKALAEYAADILSASLYEIQPEVPYTSADLNYNDNSSRSSRENNDETARPAISGAVENMEQYDTVFLGYPIWWGQAPRIISTFLESYDFSGKTIVPFCTSGSSGIGSSAENLRELCAENTTWLSGSRFGGGTSRSDLEAWINGLNVKTREDSGKTEIAFTVGDTVLTATMLENPTAQDFINSLPLTLTFEDYNSTEKISNLPRELSGEDAAFGYDPSVGDICYYAPWGNLCIFYNDFGYSSGLIPLGHIDSGIETLANMNGDFAVTTEIVD